MRDGLSSRYRIGPGLLVLAVALGWLATAGCESAPGDFDPFEVTVNVVGGGTGDGLVTEIETVLDIHCHIVDGEPNQLSEVNTANRCRGSFTDLNGLGAFQLTATPDEGNEFVSWTGDCESVQANVCQMSFASHQAVTLTAVAEFQPVGLIIAPPSVTFRPSTAP